PNSPEWDQGHPVLVIANLTLPFAQLKIQVVAEEIGFVKTKIGFLTDHFSGRNTWHVTRAPNLAMRVRVTASHHGAFILEDLHISNRIVAGEIFGLFRPGVNHVSDGRPVHLRNRQVVARREADHPTSSGLCVSNNQTIFVNFPRIHFRRECGEVVGKNKSGAVSRIARAPRPRISGTEIALRIIRGQVFWRRRLDLPLPRPLSALRGTEYPLLCERVIAPVGSFTVMGQWEP